MPNRKPSDFECFSNDYSEISSLPRTELCIRLKSAGVPYETKDSTERLRRKLIEHLQSKEEQKQDRIGETRANDIVTMESKIKLEFELGKDDWETFIERLELYFTVNNTIDEKKQAAILLTKVSPDTYKLIKNLCYPQKPKDKTFKEIVEILTNHLCPKPSETMERCKFYATKQTMTESVSDYVVRLKELSLNCNFSSKETAL
uniref:uncharacterized protein LOC117611038 n=1 Tax=Osmia lignaria TaxID=473952 RepID=UPI00147843EE|nr:uncharacterized protein LOC117611038 [Osmia lignaria]